MWAGLVETARVPVTFPFDVPLMRGGWGADGKVKDT